MRIKDVKKSFVRKNEKSSERTSEKSQKKIVVVLNSITWYEYAQQQMNCKVLKANQTDIFECTYIPL